MTPFYPTRGPTTASSALSLRAAKATALEEPSMFVRFIGQFLLPDVPYSERKSSGKIVKISFGNFHFNCWATYLSGGGTRVPFKLLKARTPTGETSVFSSQKV